MTVALKHAVAIYLAAVDVMIGKESQDFQPVVDKSGELNIYRNEGSQQHLGTH